METNPDLTDALAIDVGTLDAQFYQQRREAVRRRFLAGLIQEVSKLPPETCLWVNLSAKSSPDWVMGAPTQEEHARLLKETSPEAKLIKKLVKDLGETRSAISSTTRASQDALGFRLSGWFIPTPYSAEELVWVAQQLLLKSEVSFQPNDVKTLKAAWLELKVDSSPDVPRRGPRL